MDHEHNVLEYGHGPGAPDVETPDQNGNGNDHQGTLPVGRSVVWVRHNGRGLDQRAHEKRAGGSSGLPGQSRHPA